MDRPNLVVHSHQPQCDFLLSGSRANKFELSCSHRSFFIYDRAQDPQGRDQASIGEGARPA